MSDSPSTIIATIPKNAAEKVVIALEEFRGHHLVDLRVYAAYDSTGEARATKKGVSLQVAHLPSLIEALQDAAAEARRRGLLPDERSPGAIRQERFRAKKRDVRDADSDGCDAGITPRDDADHEKETCAD